MLILNTPKFESQKEIFRSSNSPQMKNLKHRKLGRGLKTGKFPFTIYASVFVGIFSYNILTPATS